MAFLVSDRTSKLDTAQDQQCHHNCADIWELVYLPIKQIIHGMRTTENVRCWNSQKVRKVKASTVNTNQDKNKNR